MVHQMLPSVSVRMPSVKPGAKFSADSLSPFTLNERMYAGPPVGLALLA